MAEISVGLARTVYASSVRTACFVSLYWSIIYCITVEIENASTVS
jgi:hypothetical protein